MACLDLQGPHLAHAPGWECQVSHAGTVARMLLWVCVIARWRFRVDYWTGAPSIVVDVYSLHTVHALTCKCDACTK